MRLPFVIFGLSTLSVAVAAVQQQEAATPLWDMIPGIAQAKSAVQLAFGDSDGAARTQRNFLDVGLIASQLRSAYYLVTGEPKTALDIQWRFASNLEGIVDAIPLVGHLKGGIHLLVGDDEHGWSAMKSATSTAGTIVGGLVAGPAGAVGGHVLTDALITVADAMAAGNATARYYGTVDYLDRFARAEPGEHFDAIAGLIADFGAGAPIKNTAANALRDRAAARRGYAELSPRPSAGDRSRPDPGPDAGRTRDVWPNKKTYGRKKFALPEELPPIAEEPGFEY